MTVFSLTPDERQVADFLGRLAFEQVTRRSARNRLRGRVTSVEEHIDAAGSELATAKYLNRYPTALEGRGARADVGTDIQVRSTRNPNGFLYVHPEDPHGHTFCLVVVLGGGDFDLKGSITGAAAARWPLIVDRFGHRGWRIRQRDLEPIRREQLREFRTLPPAGEERTLAEVAALRNGGMLAHADEAGWDEW